ncbi:hypothetical protein [Brevundimonas sp.]|uniref:hypothetical protein n=1 Tax=Brevundimonas sp. TaxID=1871086 RepID=UPI001206B475|nr:hypothetical protein [Brevundimonas sp.]TAJ60171.1 MAG: hypothetical protein EPO49_09610 [Brevundimonas sp.]
MPDPDYAAWFRAYADAYTRSLGGAVQVETIRSFFAETVLALGTDGSLNPADTGGDAFAGMLEGLYSFSRAIGTRRMEVERVEISPLYEKHDRVRVFYRADYARPDGSAVSIPFDVVYLVQQRAGGPAIFAFIAGDEMALYRRHGLVDEDGAPLPRVAPH